MLRRDLKSVSEERRAQPPPPELQGWERAACEAPEGSDSGFGGQGGKQLKGQVRVSGATASSDIGPDRESQSVIFKMQGTACLPRIMKCSKDVTEWGEPQGETWSDREGASCPRCDRQDAHRMTCSWFLGRSNDCSL